MLSADKKYFSKEHYETHNGFAPVYLCELVVHCLELVSQLSWHQLKFRFKGGNSLLILLQDPQRFSIDVDIVCTISKEELIVLIDKVVHNCDIFTHYEIRQHKTKPWLPMISFKLFFRSFYQTAEEAYVMLDAVLEEPPYNGIIKPVKCSTLYESDQQVEVPVVSGLIADKLLTLGPDTLGIPLNKNKEAQRLKHVFDVALLLGTHYDLAEVKNNLFNCIKQENSLQKKQYQLKEIISDTRKFCQCAMKYDEKPDVREIKSDDYLREIVIGFDEFKKHLFKINYTWQALKKDFQIILTLLKTLE